MARWWQCTPTPLPCACQAVPTFEGVCLHIVQVVHLHPLILCSSQAGGAAQERSGPTHKRSCEKQWWSFGRADVRHCSVLRLRPSTAMPGTRSKAGAAKGLADHNTNRSRHVAPTVRHGSAYPTDSHPRR